MKELEESMKKMKQRYILLGYSGPDSFTTDHCCQERSYWNSLLSFLDNYIDADHVDAEDIEHITEADMPFETREPAYNADVAMLYVGQMSAYLDSQPPELRVIIVDCEWRRGVAKADVVSIDTLNGDAPYLFCVAEISKGGRSFPRCLKDLLEDSSVSKVGNRIHCDVKQMRGWEVDMAPVVKLGHLVFDRTVSPDRAPSLASLVGVLWHGVAVFGKDHSSPQILDWSGILTTQHAR